MSDGLKPMPYAQLVVIQPGQIEQEVDVGDDVISIGRALDNTVCLEGDTNASRYHAEIERRGDTYFVLDLGSSNGTTLNDQPVEFERQLQDADVICLGGSTIIEVHFSETPWGQPSEGAKADVQATAPKEIEPPVAETPVLSGQLTHDGGAVAQLVPAPVSSGPSPLLIVAGVAGGLVLTALVAVIIIGIMSRGCNPTVRIASPQTGTTLRGPTAIHVEVEEAKCLERVVYQLDGVEIASAETAPYDVIIDPVRLRNFTEGNHTLSVSSEDTDGVIKVQETILLALDRGTTSQTDTTEVPDETPLDQTINDGQQDASIDVRSLADRLAGQISRKSGYVFDRDFVEMVRVRSNEYRISGYTNRARRYRREINKAFRDQGLDPLLGYMLAMSRSKFNDNATGEGIGLWQMPLSVAQAQGYLTAGESQETLKDPRRSAEIAAAYTKALISTFESTDDFMFAVACFGSPLNEAGQVRTQLATLAPDPLARRDFMKMVKLGVVKGDQVDRVVRFFAAGVVTENPRPFGLQSDEPFSTLF